MSSEQMQVEASSKTGVSAKAGAANYGYNLSLDPDTASNYLILSEENKKATRGDWQNYPEKPERFENVLCKESLTGRHYFEVEWSTGDENAVGVALAYQINPRKGKDKITAFGYNNVSWYFGINNRTLRVWHDNKNWTDPVPDGGCSRVGVYLDWAGGSLSFYRISSGTLTHLHTFKAKFTEPLYPGLFVYSQNNHATLCSV